MIMKCSLYKKKKKKKKKRWYFIKGTCYTAVSKEFSYKVGAWPCSRLLPM